MNPETGYGWEARGKSPRNRATRKKGQQTWSCYLTYDPKEERLAWRYTEGTNQWHTAAFLSERVAWHEKLGHRALVLVWDPASWHLAKALQERIRAHNRQVDRTGQGVKIVPVVTPVQVFWLNPVEAFIGHAKGRVLPCRQFETEEHQKAALDRHWLDRNLLRAHVPRLENFFATLH
jgi:DDE superfamily endonuclease